VLVKGCCHLITFLKLIFHADLLDQFMEPGLVDLSVHFSMSYNVVNKTVYDTLTDGYRLMTTWLHNRGLQGQSIFLLNSNAFFQHAFDW